MPCARLPRTGLSCTCVPFPAMPCTRLPCAFVSWTFVKLPDNKKMERVVQLRQPALFLCPFRNGIFCPLDCVSRTFEILKIAKLFLRFQKHSSLARNQNLPFLNEHSVVSGINAVSYYLKCRVFKKNVLNKDNPKPTRFENPYPSC